MSTKPPIGSTCPYFQEMKWRLDATVGSRALPNQITPLITLDMKMSESPNLSIANQKKTNILLQTDPKSLLRITNVLEKAVVEAHAKHVCRKIKTSKQKLV